MGSLSQAFAPAYRVAGRGSGVYGQDEDAALDHIAPHRSRGMFERVMRTLDMPGASVRNLLSGNFLEGGQNILELVSGGLYDSGDQYAPDFGFVGNLLTDPLLYLTGGASAGLTAAKAGAGLAGRALGRGLSRGVLRGATRAGGKQIGKRAGGLLGRMISKRGAAMAATGLDDSVLGVFRMGKTVGKQAKAAGMETVEDIAMSRLKRQAAKRGVKLSDEVLDTAEAYFSGPKTTMAEMMGSAARGVTKAGPGALWSASNVARPTTQQLAREVIGGRILKTAAGVDDLASLSDDAVRALVKDPKRLEAASREALEIAGKGAPLMEHGGLRFNIPFITAPRSIALAGKNVNIAKVSPLYWLAKGGFSAAKATPAGMRVGAFLKKAGGKLYSLPFATQTGKELAHDFLSGVKVKAAEADEWIKATFAGFDEPMLADFGQSLYKIDVYQTGVLDRASFIAKHGDESALKYDKAYKAWSRKADEMLHEERKYGVLLGQIPERIAQRRLAKFNPKEAARVAGFNARGQQQIKAAREVLGGKYALADHEVLEAALKVFETGSEANHLAIIADFKAIHDDLGIPQPHDLFNDMPFDDAEKAVAKLGDEGTEIVRGGNRKLRGWDGFEEQVMPELEKLGYNDLGEVLDDMAKAEGRFSEFSAEQFSTQTAQEFKRGLLDAGIEEEAVNGAMQLLEAHAESLGLPVDEVAQRYFAGVFPGAKASELALKQTDKSPWYYSKLVEVVEQLDPAGDVFTTAPKPIDLSKVPEHLREKVAARPPKPGKTVRPTAEALHMGKGQYERLHELLMRKGVKKTEADFILRDFNAWSLSIHGDFTRAGKGVEASITPDALREYAEVHAAQVHAHASGATVTPHMMLQWDNVADFAQHSPYETTAGFRKATAEELARSDVPPAVRHHNVQRVFVIEDPTSGQLVWMYRMKGQPAKDIAEREAFRTVTQAQLRKAKGVRTKSGKLLRPRRTALQKQIFRAASTRWRRDRWGKMALREGWRDTPYKVKDVLKRLDDTGKVTADQHLDAGWHVVTPRRLRVKDGEHIGVEDYERWYAGPKDSDLKAAGQRVLSHVGGRRMPGAHPGSFKRLKEMGAKRIYEVRSATDPYGRSTGMASRIVETESGEFYHATGAWKRKGGAYHSLEDAQDAFRESFRTGSTHDSKKVGRGWLDGWRTPGPRVSGQEHELIVWKRPELLRYEQQRGKWLDYRALLGRKYRIPEPPTDPDTMINFLRDNSIVHSKEEWDALQEFSRNQEVFKKLRDESGFSNRRDPHHGGIKDQLVHLRHDVREIVIGNERLKVRYVYEIQGDDFQAVGGGDAVWASEVQKTQETHTALLKQSTDSELRWDKWTSFLDQHKWPKTEAEYNQFWLDAQNAGRMGEVAIEQPEMWKGHLDGWQMMRDQMMATRGIDIGDPPEMLQPLLERYYRHAEFLFRDARDRRLTEEIFERKLRHHIPDKILPGTKDMRLLSIKRMLYRAAEAGDDGLMFAHGMEVSRMWGSARYYYFPSVVGEDAIFEALSARGQYASGLLDEAMAKEVLKKTLDWGTEEQHREFIFRFNKWFDEYISHPGKDAVVTDDFIEWYLDNAPKWRDPHSGDQGWSAIPMQYQAHAAAERSKHGRVGHDYRVSMRQLVAHSKARRTRMMSHHDVVTQGFSSEWAEKLWHRMEQGGEQIASGGSGRGVYTPLLDGMTQEYDVKLMDDLVDYLIAKEWIGELGPEGKAIADFLANPAGRGKNELKVLRQKFVDANRKGHPKIPGGRKAIESSIEAWEEPWPAEVFQIMRREIGSGDRDEAWAQMRDGHLEMWREDDQLWPEHLRESAMDNWRQSEREYVISDYLPQNYSDEAYELVPNWNTVIQVMRQGPDAKGQQMLPGLDEVGEVLIPPPPGQQGPANVLRQGGYRHAPPVRRPGATPVRDQRWVDRQLGEIEEILERSDVVEWADEDVLRAIVDKDWEKLEDLNDDVYALIDDETGLFVKDKFQDKWSDVSIDYRGESDADDYFQYAEGPEELHYYAGDQELNHALDEAMAAGDFDDEIEEALSQFPNVEQLTEDLEEFEDLARMIHREQWLGLTDELNLTTPLTGAGDAWPAVIEAVGGRQRVNQWLEELLPPHMRVEHVDDGMVKTIGLGRRFEDVTGEYPEGMMTLLLSDTMRDDIMQGAELFQREKGAVKGAAEFLDDGRAAVKIFEGGDFSTIVHEMGHIFIPALPDDELKVLAKWVGISPNTLRARTPGEIGAYSGKQRLAWRRAQEKLARAWEKYLRSGKAPTKELEGLFAKFRQWLMQIYHRIRGPKIPDNVRRVFDSMLTPGALKGRAKLPELRKANGRRLNVEQVAEMETARQKLATVPDEILEKLRQGPPEEAASPYLPQQWTDEALDAYDLGNTAAFVDDVPDPFQPEKTAGRGGASVPRTHQYAKERKLDAVDFVESVNDALDQARAAGAPIKAGTPGVEMNAAKLIRRRLEGHSRAIEGVKLRRAANLKMGGKSGYARTIAGSSDLSEKEIQLRDRAFADWLKAGAGRVSRRDGLFRMLAWWNRNIFKKFVTIGIGPIPHPAFHVRNIISGLWMAAADPRIGMDPVHGVKHLTDALFGAFEQIPGLGKVMPRSQLRRIIRGEATDELVKGLEDLGITEKMLRDIAETQQVIRNNFVREEGLLNDLHSYFPEGIKGTPKRMWSFIKRRIIGSELPAKITEAIEDGMRLNGFVQALKNGLDFKQASQAVRDAFIDYTIVSDAHRTVRDLVPFAQFSIGMMPQTIKALGQRPRITAPIRAAMGSQSSEGEDPRLLPDYVRQQAHLPMGTLDEEGKPEYMVGLGTPFEDPISFAGAAVPGGGWARRAQRAVSRTHPLIKGGVEAMFGVNTFFGTPLDAYRRDTPTSRMLPDVMTGRQRRMVTDQATGLKKEISEVSPAFHRALGFTPASRAASTMNALLDERKDAVARIISTVTGVKVVSVDKQRELRKLIAKYLEQKVAEGDVGVFKRFFQRGEADAQLTALIKLYAERK